MATKRPSKPSLFQIQVSSRSKLPVSLVRLEKFVTQVLKTFKLKQAQLSVLFVKDGAMRAWHKKLMNDPTTTDVISISQWEDSNTSLEPNPLESVGDVIVCLDEAKRQSKINNVSYKEEVGRYIVHGILHCLGYDDIKKEDREELWALQEKLMKKHKKIL